MCATLKPGVEVLDPKNSSMSFPSVVGTTNGTVDLINFFINHFRYCGSNCMNDQADTRVWEFENLYLLHREKMRRLAWKLTRSEDKADELVSEAFARAWEGFGKFRSESSFGTWIYRILTNLVYDLGRSKDAVLQIEVESGRATPEAFAEAREIGTRIDAAVGKLSQQERAVFIHREIDGFRHAEIARRLGITESTSKVHYFHALAKLREELHDLL